jgi:hypothetical protein
MQRIHKKTEQEMVRLRVLVKNMNAYSHKINMKHSASRSERKEDNYCHLLIKKTYQVSLL